MRKIGFKRSELQQCRAGELWKFNDFGYNGTGLSAVLQKAKDVPPLGDATPKIYFLELLVENVTVAGCIFMGKWNMFVRLFH